MKKRWKAGRCLPLLILFCVLAVSCGKKEAVESMAPASEEAEKASAKQPRQEEKISTEEPDADNVGGETGEQDPEEEPEEVTLDKIESMLPLMNAVNETLLFEEIEYDGQDPGAYWELMHWVCVHVGPSYGPLFDSKEDGGFLNRLAFQELESVLFPEMKGQPAVPSDIKQSIWYDNNKDAYGFTLGDMGPVRTDITGFSANEDGTVTVETAFIDEGEEEQQNMGDVTYLLEENPAAKDGKEPVFHYVIREVNCISHMEELRKRDQEELDKMRSLALKLTEAVDKQDKEAYIALAAFPYKLGEGEFLESPEEMAALTMDEIIAPECRELVRESMNDESIMNVYFEAISFQKDEMIYYFGLSKEDGEWKVQNLTKMY